MREGTALLGILQTAPDLVEDVEVILNVLDGAVIRKTLQKLSDLLLDADHVTFRALVNNRCRNIAPE
jgi:hypothetical protein